MPTESACDDRVNLWLDTISKGGVSLDSQPTRAALLPIQIRQLATQFNKSIIICQSRNECDELYGEFERFANDRGVPIDAMVYPSRTRHDPLTDLGTCRNYDEVKESRALGLPPQQAVCIRCQHRKECQYQKQMERARHVSVGIMTGRRAEQTDIVAECSEADVVILANSRPLDALKPFSRVVCDRKEAESQLHKMADAMISTKSKLYSNYKYTFEEADAIARCMESIWGFVIALRDSLQHEGRRVVSLPEPIKIAPKVVAVLYGSFTRRKLRHEAQFMRICLAATEGRLRAVVVQVRGDKVYLCATWRPRIPTPPTLVLDPTLSTEDLSRAIGCQVESVSKAPLSRVLCQVAERCTGHKRPEATASLLRGFLAVWGRIGVIGAKEHRGALDGLDNESRAAVTFCEWSDPIAQLNRLPVVIVLGVPPVPPERVMDRLVQDGRHDAAARDGDWGSLPWTAEMPWGESATIERHGYRDQDWQACRQGLIQGLLEAALANITVPSVVVSDEALGLSFDFPPATLDDGDWRLLRALRGATAKTATVISLKKRIEGLVAVLADNGRIGLSTQDLASLTSIPERTVRWKLDRMKNGTGRLVERIGQRGGWFATDPQPRGGAA